MQLNWPQTTDHLRKAVDGLCLGINHNGVEGIIVAQNRDQLDKLAALIQFKEKLRPENFVAVRVIKISELAASDPSVKSVVKESPTSFPSLPSLPSVK